MSLGLGKLLTHLVLPLSASLGLMALALLALALGRRRVAGATLALAAVRPGGYADNAAGKFPWR